MSSSSYIKLAAVAAKMGDAEARAYLLDTASDALSRGDIDAVDCEMIALMKDKYRKVVQWLNTLKKVAMRSYVLTLIALLCIAGT